MKRYCEKIYSIIREIKVPQFLLLFYMIAVLGWTWEFLLRYHLTGTIAKWGVLYGPWAPIYGVGGILTIVLARYAAKHPLWLFTGSMAVCTVVEYVTSTVLESCYGMRWWDYSARAFNVQGKICLEVTLFFGMICLVLVYFIIPWLLRIIRKISFSGQTMIAAAITVLFVIDAVISLCNPNTAGLLL